MRSTEHCHYDCLKLRISRGNALLQRSNELGTLFAERRHQELTLSVTRDNTKSFRWAG